MATAGVFREGGHSTKLFEELECRATAAGFAAVCVAAVPEQGVKFWKHCGFHSVVSLKPPVEPLPEVLPNGKPMTKFARIRAAAAASARAAEAAATSGEDALEDPLDAFGTFLKQNMLLFTDTPLIAKALSVEANSSRS